MRGFLTLLALGEILLVCGALSPSAADWTCVLPNGTDHPGPCTCADWGRCPVSRPWVPPNSSPTPQSLSDAWNKDGLRLLREGKRSEAIEQFRKAKDVDPNNSEAHANYYSELAEQSLDARDLDSASNYAHQAEAYDSRFATLRERIDRAIEQRRHDEAMEQLSVARNQKSHLQQHKDASETVIEREHDITIQAVCNSIDHELGELSELDMQVVWLDLGAIAHLEEPEVPAALVTPQVKRNPAENPQDPIEESPEDVLEEVRYHLGRLANLEERLDELNGKKEWTEEQRKWALNHLYIVGANNAYAVNSSDSTTHGQTDFSSFSKMPAFAKCP
jgi:tetratricopeptide (TPR) repeat protein